VSAHQVTPPPRLLLTRSRCRDLPPSHIGSFEVRFASATNTSHAPRTPPRPLLETIMIAADRVPLRPSRHRRLMDRLGKYEESRAIYSFNRRFVVRLSSLLASTGSPGTSPDPSMLSGLLTPIRTRSSHRQWSSSAITRRVSASAARRPTSSRSYSRAARRCDH
jgi:hypothetical protein